MNVLKWYSAIVVSYGTLACLQGYIAAQDATDFWAVVMFAPVVFYLWKQVVKEN